MVKNRNGRRENMSDYKLTMRGIHHVYKNKVGDETEAIKLINLDVMEGEFLAIVGASGCGKSTMLRIIGGLENQYNGQVIVNGSSVTKASRDKGFIFQDHRLLPWLTVKENIQFSLPNSQKNNIELIKENLELVGLSDFENAYPKQLSGGMAQRVAIARALANKPKILLLDEPFGALDAITRMNLQEQILKIWRKEKITMIIVTHDIDEAILLSDRIYILADGVCANEIKIDAPKPRTTEFNLTDEFLNYKRQIVQILHLL